MRERMTQPWAAKLPPMDLAARRQAARGEWERRWLGETVYHLTWDLIDASDVFAAVYFRCTRPRDRRAWLEQLARLVTRKDADQVMALLRQVPALAALLRRLPAAQAPRFLAQIADVATMPRRTAMQREWAAMTAATLAITWTAFLDEPAQGLALARGFADVATRAVA